MNSEKQTIFITGAAGYIGSVASYLLLQRGYRVCALDNFSTGHKDPILYFQEKFPESFSFYQRDLRDPLDDIFAEERPGLVLHYAAFCSVTESMTDPGKYFSNNVCGSQNLLLQMDRAGVKKIVFSSSCAVYGESQYVPMDEKHPTNPVNPYGVSKLMIEEMIDWYEKLKDFRYIILRYFNVCGASDDGEIGDSKKPSVLLMQNAVRGALGIEPFYLTSPVVDTPDGTPIRDYINVVDLNEAHIQALEYLVNGGRSEVINLGTGQGNSVLEIVSVVQKETGKRFDLQRGEPRQGEYAKVFADNKKAKRILGWEPGHSLQDSVKSLIKWYAKYPLGWKE